MRKRTRISAFVLSILIGVSSSMSVPVCTYSEEIEESESVTEYETEEDTEYITESPDEEESEAEDSEEETEAEESEERETEAESSVESSDTESFDTELTSEENESESTDKETEIAEEAETEEAISDEDKIAPLNETLEPVVSLQAVSLAQVKKMIEALPTLENVRASHRAQIMEAWNAYNSLSKKDQNTLDEEIGTNSGQSYGRDLESAYWGLLALNKMNAATALPKGTYSSTTTPKLESTYSKGKSSSSRQRPWSVKQITVDTKGQVTGVIEVESDSYTYIRTNGQKYMRTNTSGNCEFAGVPIQLNSTFYIAAYSTSMKSEIAFSITTSIEGGTPQTESETQADTQSESQSGSTDETGAEKNPESETHPESEKPIPLTRIRLSKTKLTMNEKEVHDPLTVSFTPKNTTYSGVVTWKSSNNKVIKIDKNTGEISAISAGTAEITAKAGKCTASCTITVKEKKEEGIIHFHVSNRTAMFKVVDAYMLTKKGNSYLYITLGGDGYRELFLGTYDEAVATGSDSSSWIQGKTRSDKTMISYTDLDGSTKTDKANGKWQFVLPVSQGSSVIQLQALSNSHKKDGYWWYPRQLTVNTKKKTLVADDYHGTESLTIKNSSSLSEISTADLVIIGGPHSNNYQITLNLDLGEKGYGKAYLGTAEKAEKNPDDAITIKNQSLSLIVEEIIGNGNSATIASRIGTPFALSFYSDAEKKWITCEVTINRKKGKITFKTFGKDSQDTGNSDYNKETEVDPDRINSNSNTMPGVVNNSTTLEDGVYYSGQFRFTYSGGSGRVIISCSQVEVRDGKAYATITFSRTATQGGSSNYDSVRANGTVYSGKNTFTIPVELNKNNTIVGRTIAMSAPHWVEYTIFIGMSEPGKEQGQDVSENTKEMDEKAPSIMGLQEKEELKLEHAEYVKVFTYEEDFYLIEVDAVKGTIRASEEYKNQAKEQETEAVDAAETEEILEEEGSAPAAVSEEKKASVYANDIVKYLVIPAGKEAPAGLEKDVVIIQQPVDRVYVSSKKALEIMKQLNQLDRVNSVGLSDEELSGFDTIQNALLLPEENEKSVVWGGSFDDWELRKLLKRKTNLMIESSEILPNQMETVQKDMEKFLKLGDRSSQMGAAMFLDRSGDEKDEKAQEDWIKVYSIIFDCMKQAD